MTFDEQLDAMLDALPRRHRIAFLAGVRFVQGYREHGSALFDKSEAELLRDEREELADRFMYRMRRKWLINHRG
jgi:hypothetical protein